MSDDDIPDWYRSVARSMPPLVYFAFGLAVGAIVAVYFRFVDLSGDIANLLGGIVGPGLGAGFGVWGALYVERRKAAQIAQQAEDLAGAKAEKTLAAVRAFAEGDLVAVCGQGTVEVNGLPQGQESTNDYDDRILGALADGRNLIRDIKDLEAPTAASYRALQEVIKDLEAVENRIITLRPPFVRPILARGAVLAAADRLSASTRNARVALHLRHPQAPPAEVRDGNWERYTLDPVNGAAYLLIVDLAKVRDDVSNQIV